MISKELGSSGVFLPPVGFGCMGVGGYFRRDQSMDDDWIHLLRIAIEKNLTFLDIAENYAEGHSEELVGRAIIDRRQQVFLATKVSPEHLTYDDVMRSAEGSLKRLQTDYIDLYQIHWPNPRIPLKETMAAFERLVKEKLVRYIGVSNFSKRSVIKAQEHLQFSRIQSVQVEYNLFDRTVEDDLLPYCEQEKISLIAYSPLDKGKVFEEITKVTRLDSIAERYGKTRSQVALSWLAAHPAVFAIPKAGSERHIIENAVTMDFSLDERDAQEIGNIFMRPVVKISPEVIATDDIGLDGFIPSPDDLAMALLEGEPLKPIRVIKLKIPGSPLFYQLVEGKLRYWAWVKAFGNLEPIPALIRGDE